MELTDEMKQSFDIVTSGAYEQLMLIPMYFDGKETAVIVSYHEEEGSEEVLIIPHFIYATDELVLLLKAPEELGLKESDE